MARVIDSVEIKACACVGCQHHEAVYEAAVDESSVEYLTLVPEPKNPYDALAISVLYKGELLGYVSSETLAAAHDFLSDVKKLRKRHEGAELHWVWSIDKVKWRGDIFTWFEFGVVVEVLDESSR